METPKNADQRLEEAADWFEQKREGAADHKAFDLWMRDSRNMEAWLETVKANEGLQTVRGGVELIRELGMTGRPETPANDPERACVSLKVEPKTKSAWHTTDRRDLLYGLGGIGGIAIVGGGAWMATAKESAQTSVGMQRLVTLPDGAILDLNTDTKVLWRVDSKNRDIWLERGEMALSARNTARPFLLKNDDETIMALSDGEVNVRRTGKSLNVTVVSGAALLPKVLGGVSHAEAGTLLTSTPTSMNLQSLPKPLADRSVLWKQRQLSFDGETLAQAVAEFNRYLPDKIRVTDPDLNSLQILATGNWQVDAPEEFLDSLTESFDVSVSRDQGGGYIVGKKIAKN